MDKLQKLNDVLNYIGHNTTWVSARTEFPDAETGKEEIRSIIRKLQQDGYAIVIDPDTKAVIPYHIAGFANTYKIWRTFDGDVFAESGGYIQQRADKLQEITDRNSRNQRMERNEARLVAWTRNLTYGTIAIVLWEVLHYLLEHHFFSGLKKATVAIFSS